MRVKYQVFISSTYEDLRGARERVIRCVLEMGHIPVGMEMFSAANEEQWNLIQRQIDECDYYLVIVAHRYGSMDKGVGFTEKEYDYAIGRGIPVLGFVIEDTATWPKNLIDTESLTIAKLESFKQKVRSRMVSHWSTEEDLHAKTAVALSKAVTLYERPGYVRGDEIANKDVYDELARLSNENSSLRAELAQSLQRAGESKEKAYIDLIATLEGTKRPVKVRFEEGGEFKTGRTLSLLEIFEVIGKYLLVEADEQALMAAIAFSASGRNDYYRPFPLPSNRFAEWMADLFSLGLVEGSSRPHSLADGGKYWTLTSRGRAVMRNLRRLKLMKGLPTTTAVAEGSKAKARPAASAKKAARPRSTKGTRRR